MRKYAISIALAASCAFAGALVTTPATAAPLSPNIGAAAADANLIEQVHCRPGRWHHRHGPADGCYRENRSYYYYDDGPYYRDRYYYRSPSVGIYGHGRGLYFGW